MSDDTTVGLPFPEASPEADRQHLAVAPDGTLYAVPSGTHERLRRVVVSTAASRGETVDAGDGRLIETDDPERVVSEPDPKVALALAGWTLLQTDGLTDRLYVDAPDGLREQTDTDGVVGSVRAFAEAHDAGRVTAAFHPSGRVQTEKSATAFE